MRQQRMLSTVLFLLSLSLATARISMAQPTWTELATSGGPVSGREAPSAVYDPTSNRLIVFGGSSLEEPCCDNSLNETWVLTNANGTGGTPTWMQLTPSAPSGLPPARTDLSAVYDSTNNRMIIFGGGQFGPSLFHALFNDVWVLTYANGLGGTPTWMPLTPTGGPPPARAGHEAVYDAQNNRMIVYGGGNNGIEDVPTDVWVLTNANGLGGTPTWLQFSPPNGSPAEEHYATGYDPNTNRMIFFGGCCYWTNNTWVLENANGLGGAPAWMQLSPGGTLPALRQTPAYGYDPSNNFLLIFGTSGPGGAYNDTWQLLNANGAAGTPTWTNLIPNGEPSSPPTISGYNTSSASGYDVANQRLISLDNTPVSGGGAVLQPWVLALQPPKPQVLIVPGILGTKLFAPGGGSGGVVWLSDQTIQNALTLTGALSDTNAWNTFGIMAFSSYNNPSSSPLSVGPIFSLDEVPPGNPAVSMSLSCPIAELLGIQFSFLDCQNNFFTYNSLYNQLVSAGYIPQPSPAPAVPYGSFPYDWRRDVRDSGDDLYQTIMSMRNAYRSRPVSIVAHSEGGLVVTAMLVKHPELYTSGDLADIILLGTPLEGAVVAYGTIRGFVSPLAQLFSPAVAEQLSLNWPSLYEMMPHWTTPLLTDLRTRVQSYSYSDVYSGNVGTDLKQFFPQLLTQAQTDATAFWTAALNLSTYPRAHAIVGVGNPTLTQLELPPLNLYDTSAPPCVEGVMGSGDGTVPYSPNFGIEQLWIPANEFRYISAMHVDLPSNSDVINGILTALSTGQLPTSAALLASPTTTFPSLDSFQKCSPIDLTITTNGGAVVSKDIQDIAGAQTFLVGDAAQYFVPAGTNYSVNVQGTGTGVFNLFVRQVDSSGNQTLIGSFNNVPVSAVSSGTFSLNNSTLSTLQYNFAGKGVVDTIPFNVNPPTILCTGCYFITQNLRATFAFNVGYQGGVSTFTYNYRSPSQSVQFVSTVTSQISVSGTTANFSGQGTLNGKSGYNFAVTATDGGAAGSGLDTVSITITGPSNYSYSVNANVVGGDVVVHQ